MPGLDRDLVVEHRLPIKEGYKPYNLPPRRAPLWSNKETDRHPYNLSR